MNRALNALSVLLLIAVTGLIFFIAEASTATKPIQDMVAFWAAARLIRYDPYSLSALSKLEKSVGTRLPAAEGYDDSYIVKNPRVISGPGFGQAMACGWRAGSDKPCFLAAPDRYRGKVGVGLHVLRLDRIGVAADLRCGQETKPGGPSAYYRVDLGRACLIIP